MRNNIKKMLVIIPMIFLLCFSFIGIKAQAEEKVDNQSTTVTTSNQDKDNTNTTQNDNISKTNTTDNKKIGPSIEGPSPSDSNSGTNQNSTEQDSNSDKDQTTEQPQEEQLPGWRNVDGKLHYVTEDGIVEKTGWFKEKDENPKATNDNEYYLDKNYAAVTGWNKITGNWYYFNESGVKQTGWITSDYSWYHLNKAGIMEKGWITDEGNKFYLNDEGKMISGKNFIDNSWYFFDGSGKLKTGLYYDNNIKYYSTKEGIMVANQWVTVGNYRYYVKADGSVAVGDLIINGKMESFDQNGRYKGIGKMTDYLFLKFLSVGDADCSYIKLPSGETALIDTGDVKTSDKLVSFLKEQDLKKEDGKPVIDYVIITHGHSDHIGGLTAVLDNFKVKKIYMPEIAGMKDWYSSADVTKENSDSIQLLKTDYKVYEDTMNYLNKNDIQIINTVKGQYIDKDHILQFIESDKNFGSIGAEKLTGYYWGMNENSAIVYLNYADLQALFTGDMEWNSEKEFVENSRLNGGEVDVLKVPHHGHDTSSTIDFIRYVKPGFGVISRSAGSINTETLKTESVGGNSAYNNLISTGVSVYETSQKDGVSVYATENNWNLEN